MPLLHKKGYGPTDRGIITYLVDINSSSVHTSSVTSLHEAHRESPGRYRLPTYANNVAFREIDAKYSPNEVLLLPIDIHVKPRGLQATPTTSTLAGLLQDLQSCLIHLSILGDVWNSGTAPAEVHRGAAVRF